ncbi:MAG TPA: protein kinase [Bryobacteraceae bacterium]|nr:protein kinase [Bryobacteraceae bacterium]
MDRIGRYDITAEVGRGAMGIVYCATDTAIGRTVAIKTIRLSDLTDAAEHARLRERLMREAQSAGMLSHPGIVTIYDVGEENGTAYVAMEFVEGETLDRLMQARALDGAFVLSILSQTAAALDYAHKRGIVHRDIKPANIMVAEGPVAKIADFGVARFQSHQLTHAGLMVGTPSYMSPEQIQGRSVDGKSDQFSLAVIAWELLTGDKPFTGESIAALAYAIVNEEPEAAHRLNPSLDWPVDTVLRRALGKQPESRFPSCSDFTFALENACRKCRGWKPLPAGATHDQLTVAAAAATVAELPQPVPAERERSDPDPAEVPAPLRIVRWLAAVALAGALVAAAVVYGLDMLQDPPEPATVNSTPPPSEPAPAKQAARKPTAMPQQLPGDEGTPQGEGSPAASAADRPGAPPTSPDPPSPTKPRAATAAGETRLVTNPPGAFVVVDGASAMSCSTPCSLALAPGRHTLAATMQGYRRTLRIFESPRDSELFINLDRAAGTVTVRSDPPGATITVDGEVRSERTPAVLNLPAGSHVIAVERNGQQESQTITVRDSAISNVTVSFDER